MIGETITGRFAGRLGAFALDAAFALPARGVTVLFGPSGCGKTTLLRAIAGLVRLDGELIVAGEAWQATGRFRPPHRRRVGYVFQEASLFPHLSVRRNLLFGRRRAGLAADAGFDEVVARLGLEPLLERGPGRLSGGERQRVAIGRALLADPALLLMDEPLAGLDAARKAEVLPYLEALHREAQIPILYVTHDMAEAARLGDRMLRMEEGRIRDLVELAPAPAGGEARDLERLTIQLAALGPGPLRAELVRRGADPALARLAVEALTARRDAAG